MNFENYAKTITDLASKDPRRPSLKVLSYLEGLNEQAEIITRLLSMPSQDDSKMLCESIGVALAYVVLIATELGYSVEEITDLNLNILGVGK